MKRNTNRKADNGQKKTVDVIKESRKNKKMGIGENEV